MGIWDVPLLNLVNVIGTILSHPLSMRVSHRYDNIRPVAQLFRDRLTAVMLQWVAEPGG